MAVVSKRAVWSNRVPSDPKLYTRMGMMDAEVEDLQSMLGSIPKSHFGRTGIELGVAKEPAWLIICVCAILLFASKY